MTEEQAEDICITAMVKAHGGQTTNSKRFFKAMRVLNMRDARELYESLSEEFVRKGIASNRFSELEQLFRIAEVSLTDWDDKEKQLTQLKQFAREASRVAEFYGDKESWDISGAIEGLQTTIIQNDVDIVRLGENESLECGGKTARNFLNSDIYKQVMEGME